MYRLKRRSSTNEIYSPFAGQPAGMEKVVPLPLAATSPSTFARQITATSSRNTCTAQMMRIQRGGDERDGTRQIDGRSSRKQNKGDLTYCMTAHLQMNAVYRGVTALCRMKYKEALHAEEAIL